MKKTEVIAYFDGIPALAKALDITKHAIYQWEETPPLFRQLQIEFMTNGELKAEPHAAKQTHNA